MGSEMCIRDSRKVEYRLTAKGLDLLPALMALRQWGERYGARISSNLVLVDTQNEEPVAPVTVRAQDGRTLQWQDIKWKDLDKPS